MSGTSPYPSQFNVPTLLGLIKTGNQRGGLHHLAGMRREYAIDFNGKFIGLLLHHIEGLDLDNSGDNTNDPAVVSPEEQ